MSPVGQPPAPTGADAAGMGTFKARLRARRSTLIDTLLRELTPIASSSHSPYELYIRLTELTDQLLALLGNTDDHALSTARQVGRDLADLLYWSTEGLERAHAVLGDMLIDAVPAEHRSLRSAVARARTAIVCGYQERTREGVVAEQASMMTALTTQLESARDELADNRARFDSVFNDSALGIWIGDLQGRTLEANAAVLDLLGLSGSELRATDVTHLIAADDRAKFGPLWTELISGHIESFQTEIRYLHHGGFPVWGHLTVTLVHAGGEPVYIVAMLQDIGEQRRMAEKLQRSDEHLRSLVQNSADLIAVVNARGEGTYFSPASLSMLGYAPEELLEQRIWPLLVAGSLTEIDAYWERLRAQPGQPLGMELRMRHKNGSLRWIGMVCTNRLDDPSINGVVMNARDITARKDLEAELIRTAHTDHLTELANRRYFSARLEDALAARRRIAVLFADLDRFKVINDSLGHHAGDEALKIMAGRLQTCVGDDGLVARIGGDEFAVLLNDTSESHAWETAERMLNVMREPVTLLRQHRSVLSTSIGIAQSGPELSQPEELLRAADLALYSAKADGRGIAAVFAPEMHEAAMRRLELEADLRRAQERGELFVAYQPEVDLATGRTVALEALVRWQHPRRGLVSPDDFVAIAEETGQIIPIGRWVMADACRQMRQWREDGVEVDDIVLALNLTSRELRQAGLIGQLSRCLRTSGLTPAQLCLEVSERILTDDMIAATPVLQALRSLGVQIAIDDFGAGAISITSWPEMTANMLKLDKSLIDRLGPGQHGAAFIKAFTDLAHTLRMQVCAEGIETEAQLRHIRAAGCDHGQGYYFSPALRADEVPAFLTRHETHATPVAAR